VVWKAAIRFSAGSHSLACSGDVTLLGGNGDLLNSAMDKHRFKRFRQERDKPRMRHLLMVDTFKLFNGHDTGFVTGPFYSQQHRLFSFGTPHPRLPGRRPSLSDRATGRPDRARLWH